MADEVTAKQLANLATNTAGKGFGPQAPRDIDSIAGNNSRAFEAAPAYTQMNLCNIHFHENAEHKGGQFTKYAGNGVLHSSSGCSTTGRRLAGGGASCAPVMRINTILSSPANDVTGIQQGK